jgi:hypothetical protein
VRQRERDRHVGHRDPRLGGELGQLLHEVELPLDLRPRFVELPAHPTPADPRRPSLRRAVERLATVPAGEPSSAERAPDEHAHPQTLRDGQDVELDLPHDDRVRRLFRPEAGEPIAFGDPGRFLELPAGVRRGPEVPDLASPLEIRERAQGFVDRRLRFRAVDLVEVDIVGAEAPQRALDLAHDPQARVALVVLPRAHPAVDLRRQDDLVAAISERLPTIASDSPAE